MGFSPRARRWLLLVIILAALLLLLYPRLHRSYEAILLLADIGGMSERLPNAYRSQQIKQQTIHFPNGGQDFLADLYTPSRQYSAAIVLQHGAVREGKDDPRLVRFAEQLARAGFLVMVPEMPGAKSLRVTSHDIPVLRYAVQYLQHSGLIVEGNTIGIGGFSIATGLAIHAAMLPELRERIDFVLAVGGYYDLRQTLHYMTTGTFIHDGLQYQLKPNEYGKWVFVLSNLDKIAAPRQRELMRRIATERSNSSSPLSTKLVTQLQGEALAIYQYIDNHELERAPLLIQRLPSTLREEVERLDLANSDLTSLRASLLLVHGRDDNIIPYVQSIALHRRLPPKQSRLYLLNNWAHVEPGGKVVDSWQMFLALNRLLELRDKI